MKNMTVEEEKKDHKGFAKYLEATLEQNQQEKEWELRGPTQLSKEQS